MSSLPTAAGDGGPAPAARCAMLHNAASSSPRPAAEAGSGGGSNDNAAVPPQPLSVTPRAPPPPPPAAATPSLEGLAVPAPRRLSASAPASGGGGGGVIRHHPASPFVAATAATAHAAPPPLSLGASRPPAVASGSGFVRWAGTAITAAAATHATAASGGAGPTQGAAAAAALHSTPSSGGSGGEDDDVIAAELLVLRASSPRHDVATGGAHLHAGAQHGGLSSTPRRKRAAPDPSKFRGVVERTGGLFRARVYHNKECTLSDEQFATPEEAAAEYDRMALRIKGPAAELNFPERAFGGGGGASSGNAGVVPAAPAAAHSRDGDDALAPPPPPPMASTMLTTGRASLGAAEALGMMHGSEDDHHHHHHHNAAPKRRRSGRGDTHVAVPAAAMAVAAAPSGRGGSVTAAAAAFEAQMSYVSSAEAFIDAPLSCAAFLEARATSAPQASRREHRAAWAAECRRRMGARAGAAAAAAAERAAALFFPDVFADASGAGMTTAADGDRAEAALRSYLEALRRAFPGMLLEPFVLSAAALAGADSSDEDAEGREAASPALRAAQRRAAAALRALRLCARRPVIFVPEGAGAITATSALDAALRLRPSPDATSALEEALPLPLRAAAPGGAMALLARTAAPPWVVPTGGMLKKVQGFAPPGAPLPLLRRLVAAAGTLLIAPLSTAAAASRLDAIHEALYGNDDAGGRRGDGMLLPLECYLEEALPLVTWQRDRAGADLAELPPLCRAAALRWRHDQNDATSSSSGWSAARADCCARADLLPAYLLAKLAAVDDAADVAAAPCPETAAERAAWAAAMVTSSSSPPADATPPPAALLLRAAEALSAALRHPPAHDGAGAMRPAAARAALLALRPALLDLVQMAKPAPDQERQPPDPASSAAVAARAAAPLSREAAAAALVAADAALTSPLVPAHHAATSADAAAEAEAAAAGALCWLERYLCAPTGSMMRAALVTAAQEAPLSAQDAAADVRARWQLSLQLEFEARCAVRGAALRNAAATPAGFAAAALRAARGWREALERASDAAAADAYGRHRDAWGGRARVAPPAPHPPPMQ